EPSFTLLSDVDALLAGAPPALLRLRTLAGESYLALAGRRGRTVAALGRDGRIHRIHRDTIRDAVCAEFEAPVAPDIDRSLDAMRLAPATRARARAAIVRERLASIRFRGCWTLRLPASAGLKTQAGEAGVPRRVAIVVGAHLLQYTLW